MKERKRERFPYSYLNHLFNDVTCKFSIAMMNSTLFSQGDIIHIIYMWMKAAAAAASNPGDCLGA